MADVRKFDERLGEVVARQLGRELPKDDGWMNRPQAERDAYWAKVNAERVAEWHEDKRQVLLKSLPEMYRDAAPRHETSRKWLAAYDEGRCVNLGIFGPARVGKTWEMAGIVRALLEKRVPALMVRVPEMLEKLRPNADGASDLGQFQAAPVLALDDLGAHRQSAWVDEQMYLLTDYRSRNLLPTLTTSNLPVDPVALDDGTMSEALSTVYSDRLLGRLFENAAQLVIRERPKDLGPARFGAQL